MLCDLEYVIWNMLCDLEYVIWNMLCDLEYVMLLHLWNGIIYYLGKIILGRNRTTPKMQKLSKWTKKMM